MRKELYWSARLMAVAAMATALSACQKSATGQVVAVVNGDEITLPELNAEVGNAKPAAGADKDQLRALALQRLVERRLIAQQAKDTGLDRDPEYLLRQRQLNEALLIELYAKRAGDTLRVPDQAAVSRYIAAHPGMFGDRVIYSVDQIRFPTPPNPAAIRALEPLHSMDAIIASLQGNGVAFERGASKIDSAQVPPEILKQVQALPPGEPFIFSNPQGVVVSVVTGRQAAPPTPAQAQPAAVQMIRNEQLGKVLEQRLNDAKKGAEIEYQSGYGPPAKPAAGATPKAAAKS